MRRKFLSVVLCVCMMLTMAPFAFAEGVSSGGGGGSSAATLQSKIDALGSEGGIVTLDNDYTETITINTGKNITLDLNNHSLSSSTGDAIVNKGTLTIKGKGQVSTTASDSAAIANFPDAVANVNGGTYTSSEWYVIKNLGTMTITGDVTVKKPDGSQNTASLIDNGWISSTDTVAGVQVNAQSDEANLTIKSGNFEGKSGANSCSVVKNDDYGTLKIFGGTFDSTANNNTNNSTTILNWNVAEISGGNFTGKYPISNGAYTGNADKGQLTISGGTFTGTQSMFGYCMGGNGVGKMTISGGSFTAPQIGDFTGKYTLSISGGTFSFNPTIYLATGYTAKSSNSKYLVVPTKADNAVAQIDTTYYNTLADAVADASITSTDTIKLLKDTTERLTLNNGKDITLDLDGHTLSYANQTVSVRHGKLTVNGPGTIKENSPYLGAILIKGSTNQEDTNYSVVNVNGDVTLSGWAPVFVDQNSEKAYGVTVNLNGATLKAQKDTGGDDGVGLYVNGYIKDTVYAPVIKLENTTIDAQGEGMYLAGYADTTIKGGSIVGTQTGIEIRAGKLAVNDVIVTGNGTPTTVTPNGNGSTTDGVGIAIAQHTTKLPINVTISGGTISGKYAVYESNPQANDPTSIGQVKLSITGGNFNGSIAAVYSQDVKNFISGGLFTTDPSDYCVANKTGIPSNNRNYPFTIGSVEQNVEVAPATPNAVAKTEGITDTNVTAAMAASAEAAKGTTATGLDAIGGKVATDVTNDEVKNAKNTLGQTEGVTVGEQPVTLYVQPYLDITVTGAKVNEQQKATELSLSITPMVKKVASTAKKADDIALANETGKTKNATVISDTEVKNVNTPVTIKLALPNGFAQDKAKLSIKHTKANSSIEYYTGIVSTEGEEGSAKTYVTFTTNGFSPFVISAPVASIGDDVYPSLKAAVDAAQDNDTITLLKDTNENITVSKAVKFTLANKDHLKGTISAGSRYSLTKTDGQDNTINYTVTYVGGGSSSSGTTTSYNVNVNAATNGAVAADKKTASKGTTVTVTASPSKGYVVDAVKVVDKDGKDVAVTGKDGKYVFTMPGSAVTVTGTFKAETPAPVALPFTDVKSGNWFYDAVKYAYEQGLMTGTSATTFAPNGTMNRAMIVTVLYRLEKSPAVTGASKFTDVPAGQWYSDAVAWAAANKIVNGYDETTFGPMNAVTREQMAAILFRYEQVKGLENVTLEENLNRFPDQNKISAYAIPALQWAVGQKIINGNADGTLDPTGTATRAQVAQIFTNLLNK